MNKYLLILLFILGGSAISQTESPFFIRPYSTNLIPSRTIFSIAQTKDGYIYLGTDEGLVRYNGRSYEIVDFERRGTAVNGLVADGNNLFCLTFSKELILLHQDSISVYGLEDFEIEKTSKVKLIGDTLFILNKQGFQVVDKNSMKLIQSVEGVRSSPVLWDIFKGDHGQIMAFQNECIAVPISEYLKTPPATKGLKFKLKLIDFAGSKLVYDSYNNTLSSLNGKTHSRKNWNAIFLENQKVHSIQNYADEKLLICTYNGLYITDVSGNLIHHMFEGIPISETFTDREGNIWVASLNDGLFIIPDLNVRIIPFDEVLKNKDKLFKAELNSSTLYMGTHQGWVYSVDLLSQNIKKVKLQKDSELQTIKVIDNDRLYAFCDNLYTLDKDLNLLDSIEITATKDILNWKGNIYCATSIGLIKLIEEDTTQLLYGKWIRSLATTPNRKKLIANTDYGYYCLDSSNKVDCYNESALKYYANDTLFIYLKKNELCIHQNGRVNKIKVDYSVINYFVQGDFLFVFNRNKIYQYDLILLKKIRTWEAGFELAEEPIVNCFAFNEELVVVSEKAIQRIKIDQELIKAPIKLQFRNTSSFNEKIQIEYAGRLQLEIDVLNAVRNRGKVKLFYTLVDEWVEVLADNGSYQVSLDRLPSGEYPISFKAIDRNQNESKILTLSVDVAFPYWQKWWFFFLVGSGILFIVGLIFKYRVSQIKVKNKKELQLKRLELQSLNAKLEALRSQMNPHFIFNTINTIQSQIISADKDEAYDNLNTFSQLIRSSLEHSTKNFIPIKEDKIFLTNYLKLESIRFNNMLSYTIEMDEILKDLNPEIPSLLTQPFVENAIKHGLMHKKEGDKELRIAYRLIGQELSIEITDNGVGRAKSAEINAMNHRDTHVSYATGAIEKRLEVLRDLEHKDLKISITDLEIGTRVLIKMKVN